MINADAVCCFVLQGLSNPPRQDTSYTIAYDAALTLKTVEIHHRPCVALIVPTIEIRVMPGNVAFFLFPSCTLLIYFLCCGVDIVRHFHDEIARALAERRCVPISICLRRIWSVLTQASGNSLNLLRCEAIASIS